MILVGFYNSPFVRRVGISLHLLGLPFEHKGMSALRESDTVAAYNPLRRIPALVLDDGEVLIDSWAILDHLDQVAGPEKALIPPAGADRRAVLRLVALGVGAMEKSLSCYFERKIRAPEQRDQVILDRCLSQVLAGLAALEQAATGAWLFGGRLTQADVTAVAALDFLRLIWPESIPEGRFPGLEALRARTAEMPAFSATRP
jgi:glutathione S-transferase